MIKEKITKFKGYISSDYECFCFAVPLETFKKHSIDWEFFESNPACLENYENPFFNGHYNLYPYVLMPEDDDNTEYEIEVVVRLKPI